MLKTKPKVRRTTVTVEDSRAVMLLAKARKPKDIAVVKQEDFIRRELKSRLGWPQAEPASQALKDAARKIADNLKQQAKEAEAAKAAKLVAEQKAKAESEAKKIEEALGAEGA